MVLANVLPTTRTVWIEHYEDGARGTPQDRATFDLLTFSGGDPGPVLRAGVWRVELGSPSWKALDCATVGVLDRGYANFRERGLGELRRTPIPRRW